jgi:phage terminase large subunit-like protein
MHDTANPYPNVPAPVDAVSVFGWDPDAIRYWVGSERTIHIEQPYHDDIKVMIDGVQHSDGRVDRCIVVGQLRPDGRMIIDEPITSQQARDWAAALIAAADEIEAAIVLEWS